MNFADIQQQATIELARFIAPNHFVGRGHTPEVYREIAGPRRSFASLCEWMDIPGGISAQIQGHAPQGVSEQSYIRRPLDLLRVHHEKIEAWILEQAGVTCDAVVTSINLRAVC